MPNRPFQAERAEQEMNKIMRCEICGKTTVFGNKVAHDRMYINRRSPKKIKPNLQRMKIQTPGGVRQITVCTRCMRTMRKQKLGK